jgi:hypothetical protein
MPQVEIFGNSYDSYADLPTAIEYLSANIEASDFLTASADVQGQALVSMTRTLNRQQWQGKQTDGYETMAWPRSGLFYPDGTPVDPNSIPDAVVSACCEGAADLCAGSNLMDAANTFNYTKRLKAGSVEIENFRQVDDVPRFPQVVQELIGFWLGGGGDLPVGSQSSGTCGKTIFNESYDVNRGF